MGKQLTEKYLEIEKLKTENMKINNTVEQLLIECAKFNIKFKDTENKSKNASSGKNLLESSTKWHPKLESIESLHKSTPSLTIHNCNTYGLLCCDHTRIINQRLQSAIMIGVFLVGREDSHEIKLTS